LYPLIYKKKSFLALVNVLKIEILKEVLLSRELSDKKLKPVFRILVPYFIPVLRA